MKSSEAAEILGVSRKEVSRLLKSGLIDAEKVGNRWVITQDAVDDYQTRRRKPGRPPKKSPVYTLMNDPYEVAVFAFDESDDKGGFAAQAHEIMVKSSCGVEMADVVSKGIERQIMYLEMTCL